VKQNLSPAKGPPVLIIGAHRSGTSATARALQLLGLQMGNRLDSHHECKRMQRMHEAYLQRAGAAWHNPKPFLDRIETTEGAEDCLNYLRDQVQNDFSSLFGYDRGLKARWLLARLKRGARWGWKEPRTTLFARCWLHLFPDAYVLDVVRHPVSVALSIRQRDRTFVSGGDRPTPHLDQLDYCLQLALTYVEAGGRVAEATPNYRRIHFESLQADPEKVLAEVASFCGLPVEAPRIGEAARSIRPRTNPPRPVLSPEDQQKLLRSENVVARLGYKMDFEPTPQAP
jgi:hypothetical protein